MPANVVFVTGRAGQGKSRFLHARVRELQKAGEPVALIVPEQFTFETERQLSLDLEGLLGVSVYSFTSLARRALKESGERRLFLSPQGKRMVIRKAAEDAARELNAFARVAQKPGFSAACDALFARFKRYAIAPAELFAAAARLPQEDILQAKLTDLALLYEKTKCYLSEKYIDEADAFNAFLRALPKSQLKGAQVILDGVDVFDGQTLAAVDTLMEIAATVYISLRLDTSPACRDAAVFIPARRAYDALARLAADRGCRVEHIRLPQESYAPRQVSPVLLHLEREAFAYPYHVYAGEAPAQAGQGIRLYAALGVEEEAEAAAEAILRAAQGTTMRYRDMAVVVAEPAYMAPLSRALRVRNIPFFADAMHPLSGFAAPRLLTAALRCACRGYATPDVMDLVRTGLCGVSGPNADIFENYILAYGVRGNAFTRPFDRKEVPQEAEAARQTTLEPLMELRTALAAAGTAAQKTEALFAYMERLKLHEQLSALSERLREQGELALWEENAQVYDHILTVLSQLHAIMGETRISNQRYLAVLAEGLDAYEVGAIPPTADQVLLGSVGRTRARDIRALFLLGANEGSFPKDAPDDGVIDDAEMEKLGALGINRWENSRDQADFARMNAYATLSKPKDLLYISYTLHAGADAGLPAAVVDRIHALFPFVQEDSALAPRMPHSPYGGLGALARDLRAYVDTGLEPAGLAPLYGWFAGQAAYLPEVERMERALYHTSSPEPFGYELAQKLYGQSLGGSATRLETYNRCPFRHFVQYGLKAQPRREYKERRADEGAFCHAALDAFWEQACALGLAGLDEPACERILDGIFPALLHAHNGGVLLDSARGRAKAARLVRAVKATAWAVVRQAQMGGFCPVRSELRFGEGGQYPALSIVGPNGQSYAVSGRIDRIDTARIEGEAYFRVVDYKSGAASFDYARLYHGLQLQLPLYVAAVEAAEHTFRAAGMYYMPVANPVTAQDDMPLEARIQKALRLRGLTLLDARVLQTTQGSDPSNPVVQGGRASLVERSELNAVVGYAQRKAERTLSAILEGGAATAPAKLRDRLECDACELNSICGFDQSAGDSCRVLQPFSKEEFFGSAANEVGE
ncbi:MAG: PD-(D/E)XK nuclease family protein [Christensenellaceae bacterium]|jgi:ATP-dependent helicase/nuclease subunit B|nr:PD-(D/E)XK nuclease family protein [Christensenellaceae bacterium]